MWGGGRGGLQLQASRRASAGAATADGTYVPPSLCRLNLCTCSCVACACARSPVFCPSVATFVRPWLPCHAGRVLRPCRHRHHW